MGKARVERIVVERTGAVLAARARVARGFWQRFRGLMLTPAPGPGEGLLLEPANSIHMFFMRYPLDVVHVARDGRVLRVLRGIRPWRVGPLVLRSRWVLELPAGAAADVREGDALRRLATEQPDEPGSASA